jgi:phosphatidylglycerol:prolipoprotein diacylglycerol transferase
MFPMIPYIHFDKIEIGPLTLYPFGLLVGTAIVVGLSILEKRARRTGLSAKVAEHLCYWSVGIGFVIGHIFAILFYYPHRLEDDPFILLKIWDGMSSVGGIVGGLTAGTVYLHLKKVRIVAYYDAFFYAFTFAWAIARLGCSLVHDHPGIHTDFFLAVNYPDGPRHDLGFYEFLTFVALSIFFYSTRMKPRFAGFYISMWGMVMVPMRFVGDFLRSRDIKYFASDDFVGLTAGQIGMFFVFVVSLWALLRWKKAGAIISPIVGELPSEEVPHAAGQEPKKKKKKKK